LRRQVHQDIDAIRRNALRDGFVGHTDDVAPAVRAGLKAFGHVIVATHLGITENLELLMIVLAKQGQQIASHYVVAEIPRDVADPQTTAARSLVGIRLRRIRQRSGEL
jgi:hypothetical protein